MTPEEQMREDVRWLEGEATAEEALAERFGANYPLDRPARIAAGAYSTSAARLRRILAALSARQEPNATDLLRHIASDPETVEATFAYERGFGWIADVSTERGAVAADFASSPEEALSYLARRWERGDYASPPCPHPATDATPE